MNNKLTIVMYHYIRELEKTRYPKIKGRRTLEFLEQLQYLKKHYRIVTMEEVIHCARRGQRLPENAALLTFDDGYIEHYTTVFPILFDMGLQGSFFPPVATAKRGELLDVNRIHFLLAVADPSQLACEIDNALLRFSETHDLLPAKSYHAEWAKANRFDDAETIYVKRMLQHVLPDSIRHKLTRELFATHVAVDEVAFAAELYLNADQLRLMQRCGMYVGSHGDSHYWLNTIDPGKQSKEIEGSIQFLKDIGSPVEDFWVMCYPYGAYNESLLEALRVNNCALGLTTEVDIADLRKNDPLLLPRLDTNDIPISG